MAPNLSEVKALLSLEIEVERFFPVPGNPKDLIEAGVQPLYRVRAPWLKEPVEAATWEEAYWKVVAGL